MIPNSGNRFSEQDHAPAWSMIPNSGNRFSEQDHAAGPEHDPEPREPVSPAEQPVRNRAGSRALRHYVRGRRVTVARRAG
jgi:hypothetical protein